MILACCGTRPEWIKVKPIVDLLGCKVLFTGQHEHLISSDQGIKLEIKDYGNRLDSIFCSIMQAQHIFDNIDAVLVQGDTASSVAIALAAFNKGIKVIHLEAGLRTYDMENPYPEEAYRQIISRITDVHLCPTKYNKKCLENEKVSGSVHVVGNTVLDNLINLSVSYNNEILVTMHRRENHAILADWFKKISELALENPNLKFVIPLHPNPNVQKHKAYLSGVKIIEPLSYEKMKKRISQCRLIISDSGGLQEEASFLRKKIIVCRKITERIESLNKSSFLCQTPIQLKPIFNSLKEDYIIDKNYRSPYGDGTAAIKIQRIIEYENFVF